MPSTNASNLLCDENSDLKMSAGPTLTLGTGHPNMDPQVLLLDDSSETETDVDLSVPEPDIVPDSGDVHHHYDELNVEYNMTQSTMGKQQLGYSSVFIKIMSSHMLMDGAGVRIT